MWEVEFADEFEVWWTDLDSDRQEVLTDRIDLLAERGPDLGRPIVDRIARSRHHNMKELRASEGGALRVLFAFDPRRQVILLNRRGPVRRVERLVRMGDPNSR